MNLSFSIPDDLQLRGMEESKRGWMVYLSFRGDNYLQGQIGGTPQEAVDQTEAVLRKNKDSIKQSAPVSGPIGTLTLEDLDF